MSLNNEADENDKIVAHPSPSTLYYRILTVNINRRDPNTKWKTKDKTFRSTLYLLLN